MADDSNTDRECELAEKLAFYDDDFPRDPPTWDEDAVVTPRAFLSEYGYDVEGERLPEDLARVVFERDATVREMTLVRTFGDPEGFAAREGDKLAGFIERGAYNQVEIYRVDEAGDEEEWFSRYANGGFLLRYSYIRREDKRKENEHARYGYYWVDIDARNELIKKLLCGPNEGPWADDYDRREMLRADWEEEPNPAEGESWVVGQVVDTQVSKQLEKLDADPLVVAEPGPDAQEGPFESVLP